VANSSEPALLPEVRHCYSKLSVSRLEQKTRLPIFLALADHQEYDKKYPVPILCAALGSVHER
jgi:translation initiation factor 2 beta subunit (eIF-2beta)/eIF-5